MNVITLDFETFYSTKFSLRRLTTEEYIRAPEFQVIGAAIKVDDGEAVWYAGADLDARLKEIHWGDAILLCHNTMFDGAILNWKYGYKPALYLDTLSMARAVHGVDAGGSLAKLAIRYGIGEKGDEVVKAEGLRLEDFSEQQLAEYGKYCENDVNLTYQLFNILTKDFPVSELHLIDMTLRMFITPKLEVDDALLLDRLEEVKEEKSQLLQGLMQKLGCETEEDVRKKLASNKQFAELLTEYGITVPMKVSKTTGKDTYALAKNDEGFIALTEHEDPFIQQLCAVRLGTKSTIEESRIERFIQIGSRNKGRLPIPLRYYGAHTGRWAGSDKVNFQNLPSRDKKKKALKNAILPPEDHVIINCDSSQIEARVLVWWAGQAEVLDLFASKQDAYRAFASKVYNKPPSEINSTERFVGKTCIAEGTLVLCESGWKPIETVTTDDKVWDGQEWVCHQGLVNNGYKKTLNLLGSWLTPDHLVWSGTEWLEAQSIKQDSNILSRALAIAAENLPSQATLKVNVEGLSHSLLSATVEQMNILWTHITSKLSKVLDVMYVRSRQVVKNVIGLMLKPFQMTLTELDFLTDLQLQSHVATRNLVNTTSTMDREAYTSTMNGVKTKPNSCCMFRHVKDGIILSIKWIVSTTTKGMNQVTFGLYLLATTQKTSVESPNLKPVYDILNSGSRNRFTILTDNGALIVHNCVLGLGYGTGWAKLQHTLKTTPPGADLSEEECRNLVNIYRETNDKVIELWRECDETLSDLATWPRGKQPYFLGGHNCVLVTPKGLRLPNGLYITYPDLHWDTSEAKGRYVYKSRKGPVSIWGGSVVENVVQALARIIVGEQMNEISQSYPVVLTVHDAAVVITKETEADSTLADIIGIMSKPPEWGINLPIACEGRYGKSYGEC